jgi:hypothetical protein
MATCFVSLNGGLGNQLFQIAAGFAHSKRNGYRLSIAPHTNPGRPVYWDSFLMACKPYVAASPPISGYRWYEPSFSYTAIPKEATILGGYYQCSRYFADCAADIRALFIPSDTVQSTVKERYSHLVEKPYVVMHVRRGDYFIHGNQHHGILTSAYYRRAMALFPGPPSSFLVISDDPAWCKAQPWLSGTTILEEPDECVTLWLMAQFREFILSNSSFSWWAAWLSSNKKKVVVPATWFGPGGPTRWEDVYEPDWIRLPIDEESSEKPSGGLGGH